MPIRVLRVVATALTVAVVLSGVGLGFFFWSKDAALANAVAADLEDGEPSWQPTIVAWDLPPGIEEFSLLGLHPGNAVAIYTPADGPPLRCPFVKPLGPGAPQWDDEDRWSPAADCPDLEHFLRAAHLEQYDPFDRGNPSELVFASRTSLMGIESGVGALVARSVRGRRAGNFAAAETDLRAAVGIGLQLLRGSPAIVGLELGNEAVSVGLKHLASLFSETERSELASRAATFADLLPRPESCRGPLKTDLPRTAAIPIGMDIVANVVDQETLPLAVRVHALTAIMGGYVFRSRELLFGPMHQRRELIRQVAERNKLQWASEVTDRMAAEPLLTRVQWAVSMMFQ